MSPLSTARSVRLLGATVSMATLVGWVPNALAADERPNIVLIVADDMGYADMGMLGGGSGRHHLDTLARGASGSSTSTLLRRVRRPAGLRCAWIMMDRIRPQELYSVIASFHAAFPFTQIIQPQSSQEVLLIGSNEKISLDIEMIETTVNALCTDEPAASTRPVQVHGMWDDHDRGLGIHNGYDLLAQFVMGTGEVEAVLKDAATILTTDDNSLVEFRWEEINRPFGERSAENFARLAEFAQGPAAYITDYDHLSSGDRSMAGALLRARLALAMQRYGRDELAFARLVEARGVFLQGLPVAVKGETPTSVPQEYFDLGGARCDTMNALNRLEEATSIWESVHSYFPEAPIGALRLAQISPAHKGDPDAILQYTEEAITRATAAYESKPPAVPGNSGNHLDTLYAAWASKAAALLRVGRLDEAVGTIEGCECITSCEEAPPEFLYIQAKAYLAAGRVDEARSVTVHFTEARPYDPQGRFLVGHIHESIGGTPRAGEQWMLAAQMARSATRAYFRAAAFQYHRRRSMSRAIDHLDDAVTLKPLDGEPWTVLGRCYLEQGRESERIEAPTRGVQLRPTSTKNGGITLGVAKWKG